MPFFKPILLFALQLLLLTSAAQQRIGDFTAYGRDNGLPQNAYHEVFESSDGYLWASSASGLFRFDGKRFLQINSLYSNPNSPADNNIVGFEEDNAGNLWIAGFFSGVSKYNLRSGRFRQYKRLSPDSTAAYGTFCVYKDKQGTIWIGTAGRGLAEYLPASDTFRLYYPEPTKTTDGSRRGDNFVTSIIEDTHDANLFWISAFQGLYLFNKTTKQFTRFDCPIMIDEVTPLNAFLKVEQDANNIYLGTWFAGLVVFNKQTKTFSRVPYERKDRHPYHYAIGDAQMVSDSLLYLACMNDGLLCYNTRSRKLTPLLTQPDIPLRNVEINIQQVSLTKHAGLFAGGNSFIYQFHPRFTRFNQVLPYNSELKNNPNVATSLNSVTYDKYRNGYWMAVFNYPGLIFFDSSLSSSVRYPGRLDPQPWFDDVSVDGKQNVWSIDAYGVLYSFDTAKRTPVVAGNTAAINLPSGTKLLAIEEDGKGNTWLVGSNAIFHHNPATNKLITFSLPLQEIKSRNKNGIWRAALRCDSKGNAWVGTHAGLIHCDLASGNTQYYYTGSGGLASMVIKSLTIDRNDNVWIGYFNEGLQVFDTRQNKVVRSFTMEDGLPSMEINYLDCNAQNDILACTHSGLAIFKHKIGAWQYINTYDGLRRDYLDVPVFFSNGKTILDQANSFLVMDKGLNESYPDSIYTHITSISINGKPLREELLPDYINSLKLPSAVKDIKIEFSAMHWQFPFRTQYYYRVDNIHKQDEWIPVPEAVVNLTGLSSGQYGFHFYAVTADGVRTPERVLTITIRPPFWKTWWFRILLALLIMTLFYAIYKYRINQLRKLHDMRNTISRDLHDDIGASLGNISILNELAKRNIHDAATTTDYLDRAGEDIQHISESLSDIVWNINPRYDELNNLFIRMKRYAADMFDGRGIVYEISLPATTDNITLPMTRRRDFYLIFKEAIHNLVKYSQATKATIHVALEKGRLVLKVTDNGIGFDTGNVQKGNGLLNMKQRTEELRGVLKIDSAIGQGTMILLSIPVH